MKSAPLFSSETHDSTFNTVHILAAVVGVVGALVVGWSIFFLCQRKKKKQKCSEQDPKGEKTVLYQFALDMESPPVAHLTESPMMQQHQLQLRLQSQIPNASSLPHPPPPYHP
ncbi:hypothetical protein BY458DRAFT_552159 [Sporodiniella umbellata]|nr:hypothetical protein BY458DRAFT_552159 [Sporodiniella umbellata]